ncbi:Phytochelatin synthase, partial [Ochromonadaceae sp. CCMP2298]
MEGTFHRRELRAPSVAFSSQEGKQIFRMAMLEGGLEGYFHLSESFQTQGHPAWCGLGSLTTALNSLLIDPGRTWQGVWRYFDESMLDCCLPLDVIRLTGITLSKLACLARCNGARPVLRYADAVTVEEFRADVMTVSLLQEEQGREGRAVMVASYSRKPLNQTGDGHFSPVGGYCAEKDMVLIMDVARFKYPPHWVPL